VSRKVQILEANFLVTVWPGKGGCGEIRDADRRAAPNASVLAQILSDRLHAALAECWFTDLGGSDVENLPVKLVFNVVVERKEFVRYGN